MAGGSDSRICQMANPGPVLKLKFNKRDNKDILKYEQMEDYGHITVPFNRKQNGRNCCKIETATPVSFCPAPPTSVCQP